jgi:hypothetical protein
MKPALILLSFFISNLLFSQDDEWKEPSKESQTYHNNRLKLTTPPYGLAKVKELIKGIKYAEDEEGWGGYEKLDDKKLEKLSLREKFTYHMIHAESYSQNCDLMPLIQDEHKKIFGYLPDAFGENHWGERQTEFFKKNKDSVISIMTESIRRTGKIGLNYKQVMIDINATSMIPFLIEIYQKTKGQKDLDILTIFMLMMKENNDETFLKSASYRKLYGDDSDYISFLNHNKENEDLIIQRVTAFYDAQSK